MPEHIISLKTRNAFRQYFVGTTLGTIQESFDGCGVRCDLDYSPPVSGQRRTLVEQYYHTIDWSARHSVAPIIRVYENLLRELHAPAEAHSGYGGNDDAHRKSEAAKLLYWLKQDGFEWLNGRLIRQEAAPGLESLAATHQPLQGSHLLLQIQRMKDSVETDPALAIGTAKELVETVCKTILADKGKPVEGSPNIPTLTKSVLKELKLVPEGIHDAAKGADLIRAVLRSLGTIGNDLAQLRGLYGTGHGKTASAQGLQPRHARLAVGAAATLATFLFETHQANQGKEGDRRE